MSDDNTTYGLPIYMFLVNSKHIVVKIHMTLIAIGDGDEYRHWIVIIESNENKH